MNIEYFENLMNYDVIDNVQNSVDNYSFNVGDVVLDIDKKVVSDDNSQLFNNTQNVFDEMNNEQTIINETQSSFVDNSIVFDNSMVQSTNHSAHGPQIPSSGVTVNFNAYNEIHSSSTDIDSVMTAFGEKLAEAVALAAEGVHL